MCVNSFVFFFYYLNLDSLVTLINFQHLIEYRLNFKKSKKVHQDSKIDAAILIISFELPCRLRHVADTSVL